MNYIVHGVPLDVRFKSINALWYEFVKFCNQTHFNLTSVNKHFNDGYASGKFHEFVRKIFTGIEPARQKLGENLHFIAIISPEDFKNNDHQKDWNSLQGMLIGKTKNIGLQKNPIDQLTVQNKKLGTALEIIWRLYEETCC